MFLSMMGHFGAQTGYPVVSLNVTGSDGFKSDGKRDYLIVGSMDDLPAIGTLKDALPVQIDANSGLKIRDTQGFFASIEQAWWKVRSSDHVDKAQLETAGGLPDALIEGLAWPSNSRRSVVLVAVRNHDVVPRFIDSFLKSSQSSDIAQSVSVLQGDKFVSYRIGFDNYHVGNLAWWTQLEATLTAFPWLTVGIIIIICILLAILGRSNLRRHARSRLQGND